MKKKIVYFLLAILLFAFSTTTMANNDLDKEKVINLALDNNKELIKLREEVNIAKAKLKEARSGFFPRINLSTGYTRLGEKPSTEVPIGVNTNNELPNGFIPLETETMEGSADNYSFQLSVQQPLFRAGKIRIGYQQVQNNLKASELRLEQKKKEIKYQVLEQYYNVLKAEKMLAVAKQQVEQAKSYVNVAQANQEVGIFTRTDTLQAKVNYNRAKQGLLKAENGLKLTKTALKNNLGIKDQEKITLVASLSKVDAKKPKLDKAYDLALKNRIQLKTLQINQQNLELNLEMAKKDKYLPNLNLAANYQTQGDEWKVSDGNWQFSLLLDYNLFSGGQKSAKVTQAQKQYDNFKVNLSQIKDGIKLEVKQTLLQLEEAKQSIELTKLNLEQAKDNLAQMEAKYKEGLATTNQILDAQTTLKQVQTDYYQAVYDYNLKIAKLNKVLGR